MADQVMDVLKPEGMDFAAMGVAFVVAFVLSFLWWGPLFGRRWGKEMGMTMDPDNRPPMGKPLALQALGTALLAYIFWHVVHAFAYTTDASGALAMGKIQILDVVIGATLTWLGFYVPQQLGRVAWEKASWTLWAINSFGNLLILIAMGIVFALM